ncbi:MAG TPA: M14 family zinc carboxypeptidase, partial [Oscillospiraceae bacterium]|nr:M14 family zinc carboxypeptidase [Oscillospiraceae bacterium]
DFSRDWEANNNGVDLNHNFDAGWPELRRLEKDCGIDGPSPRRFGGPFPESEPETRAIISLCHEFNPRQAVSLHSQGEEIYWRYGDTLPKHAEVMAHILAISCNYTLAEPEGIASHGGFKDWFIREFDRPAFTFEIGKGKNPLPVTETPILLKRLSDTLLIAALM